MDQVVGVHVRLPDGTEDVYVDRPGPYDAYLLDQDDSQARLTEHYYTLMQDGYLFVFRTDFGETTADVTGHRRLAVYAPGGWHRVRSKWIPFTGPRHYEQLSQYE